MERRAFKRIPIKVEAIFLEGNMVYSGTVLNLSERNMSISTRRCFPSGSMFESIIRVEEGLLKVHAQVKRETKINSYNDGMGVEVLNPTKEYLEFVNRFRRKKEFSFDLHISKETLFKTTRCQSTFQCLISKNRDMCLIDRPVNNGEALLIKERVKKYESCPYFIEFDHSHICDCPTRYEIYKQYNI
jgi:hypothetical protein